MEFNTEKNQLKSLHRPKLVFSSRFHSSNSNTATLQSDPNAPGTISHSANTPDLKALLVLLQQLQQNQDVSSSATNPNNQVTPSLPPPVPATSAAGLGSPNAIRELPFFYQELKVHGLNAIHSSLWVAGAGGNISPLHRQIMMGRTILITEDPELHLIWSRSNIYIKPLPPFLLRPEFWQIFRSQGHEYDHLRALALGMLKSYSRLIVYRSDFKIAREAGLLPFTENIDFEAWFNLLHDKTIYNCESVNPRYIYGELRLNRLNWIYRFTKHQYVYLSLDTTYNEYLSRWWPLLLFLFAFMTIALTAEQVLIAARPDYQVYADVSNIFAIVVLLMFLVIGVVYLMLYILMLLWNSVKVFQRPPRAKEPEHFV